LEYCAYLSSPWPWTIILINVMGKCPSSQIILFATYNLASVVFAWFILSWTIHKNSSLDRTDSNLQVWYQLLHDFWCNRHFFNFTSYSSMSLLFFPILTLHPSMPHTQYTSQKQSLFFLHEHWDGVSSSTYSSQTRKYLQCLILY
jgi:hypothetical protein